MKHIVLIGDSVFDNAVYVEGGPDVQAQLNAIVPDGWRTTRLAIDGAVVDSVGAQLSLLPADADYLVVSVGGNDALEYLDLITRPAGSVAEVLKTLAGAGERFAASYRTMAEALSATGLPITVCTIYEPPLFEPDVRRLGLAALCVFNDVILRTAFEHGWQVIDLRLVCTEDAHFTEEIEPSEAGGERIASAILAAVTPSSTHRATWVFAG